METVKKNWNLIACIIVMIILTIVMFVYIDKKEGFHEDEIFSYTASNSSYSNILLSYAKQDNVDTILKTPNMFETLGNLIYYMVFNRDEYAEKENSLQERLNTSIWRTKDEVCETMKIDSIHEVFDYFTVYWNTSRDVHPPLFYFLVHFVSSLFYNNFSKYIIFIINLAFFLETCIILRKIAIKLNKENLAIPILILYGLSIGAISTVMFQRMYMMLTFFTVCFLYLNLKIYYNNFKIDKKLGKWLVITTILGFLTQYYFCVYAAFLSLIMLVLMFKNKHKIEAKIYIWQLIKSAIIGVVLFLPSIYHIFFSYRGAAKAYSEFSFFEKFIAFITQFFDSFSLSNIAGIIISSILAIILIVGIIKNKEERTLYILLLVPVFLSFLVICKLSPYRSLRYIMNFLPIIAIIAVYLINILLECIFKNKKIIILILTVLVSILSIVGLTTNKVKYLYIGYNDYLEVARKYSDNRFVLISQTSFVHIYDIPEMSIYSESLIIDPDKLEQLKNNMELKQENEFILSIKNWAGDVDKILKDVLDYTGFSEYELLLNTGNSANCSVYRITKK